MAALGLTVLLILLWLAAVALGYWHGGWRQVVVLAGMLLSYAALSEWAAPNGHDLATQFHWRIMRTTTAVGLLYLLGGTLVLGFLGSVALDRPRPLGARERLSGAVMGVLNGGVLLALVLRTLRSYAYVAGSGKALRTSALSRFLIEDVGYLLLAAMVFGVVAVVAGLTLARHREPEVAPVADAAATQSIAQPPQLPPVETPPARAPLPAPPAAPPRVQTPAPVYVGDPIIDWPTTPPPGTHIQPAVTSQPAAATPAPERKIEANEPMQPVPIPVMPSLPRRIEPPMWYPVAAFVAPRAPDGAAPVATTAPAAASSVPTAPSPVPAPGPSAPPRPTTPPPGASHPAFVPPTIARPPLPLPAAPVLPTPAHVETRAHEPAPVPEAEPPIVRELDVATHETPPIVRELDVSTQDVPLVIREVDVATQDGHVTSAAEIAHPPAERPQVESASTEGETISAPERAPAPPAPSVPNAVTETAPSPAITPPSLLPPPVWPGREDDAAKPRGGFARVAVARQAGQRSEAPPGPQPHPTAPGEPEPLQPPLPTGPRVHPCPICGYPVRDHARYCPNCGSRQRP